MAFGRSKDKDNKAALAEAERSRSSNPHSDAAPPVYTTEAGGNSLPADAEAIAASLGNLSLDEASPGKPAPDACLAHLRLLFAFQVIKNEVGYRDGLFDMWDERARGSPQVVSKLREKRWALYVARAVDRYTAWWNSFVPDMLLEGDMVAPGIADREGRYDAFVTEARPAQWTEDMLPPLDVMMVWHAHMLNPRLYLEDCLRYGHASMWAGGMPWQVINNSIDQRFKWSAPASRTTNWTERTGRCWANEDDADTHDMRCPNCPLTLVIPWTTCCLPKGYQGDKRPGLVGEGYGDGELKHTCKCGFVVTHDALRVAKLRDDINRNIVANVAVPGTILDMKSGLPEVIEEKKSDSASRLFPARVLRRGLVGSIVEMLVPGGPKEPTMLAVSELFEDYTGKFADEKKLKHVEDRHGVKKAVDVRLDLPARQQTRKMMSRYWQNSSPFAIDLSGCVIRQGLFTEKMVTLNWLHLPNARQTMRALLTKYERFIEIIANYPGESAVPTLDVDLGWHTHQLSPKAYYDHTVLQTKSFVDHNDKVDEQKLGVQFEWTTKIYQEKYGEVYSECRCWHCETTRTMAISSFAKMFGSMSKEEKLVEQYHASGTSGRHPEGSSAPSAHISAHPAVHTIETKSRQARTRRLRIPFRNRMDEYHEKARKRADKNPIKGAKGAAAPKRMGPRGEDTVPFWGVKVPLAGPWASATAAATTAAIYAMPPGEVNTGPGSVGSCAAGTCGGSGGCGSETLGMCTAGCTGSGWFGGSAGCSGFGAGGA